MSPFASLRKRPWLAAVALLAFTARALIPAGFMPAGEGILALHFCPDGLSPQAMAVLDPHFAHHHHGGTGHDHQSWGAAHCAFAAVASAPPLAHTAIVSPAPGIESAASVCASCSTPESHRFRIAQPRGPPSPA